MFFTAADVVAVRLVYSSEWLKGACSQQTHDTMHKGRQPQYQQRGF